MVGGAEVRDLERQVLRAEVVLFAKGDRQAYTTYGVCSLAKYDPVEGFVASGHLGEVEFHLLQHFGEDDVQTVAPVDEGLRQEGVVHYGVDYQWVGPRVWYVYPMVFPGESDGILRPTQGLWSFSVYLADLPSIRSLLFIAFSCLATTDSGVDLSVGVLERAVGIARFWWWWRRRLLTTVVVIVVDVITTAVVTLVITAFITMVVAAVVVTTIITSIITVIVATIIMVIPIVDATVRSSVAVVTSIRSTFAIVVAASPVLVIVVAALGLL
jgi:hypothetical protein